MAKQSLPHRAVQIYEHEIERLRKQRDELRRNISELLEQQGYESSAPAAEERVEEVIAPTVDTGLCRLARDLRTALAQADERRRAEEERFTTFQAEAAEEERVLSEQLCSARSALQAVHEKRRRAMQRTHAQQIRAEIRAVETEREEAMIISSQLEAELLQPRPLPVDVAQTSCGASAADAVDAIGAQVLESQLRAEATALRAALRFYRQQRAESARSKVLNEQEEALRRREDLQIEEASLLQSAEDRLRAAGACLADEFALQARRRPDDMLPELEEERGAVRRLETACEELRRAATPLQEQHDHLLWLRGAAEARLRELERRMAGLRPSVSAALRELAAGGLQGVQALVFVLAKLCGSSHVAFLLLDINCSGRVSMCEFDSGLRIRLSVDYEEVAQMKLRPLFKIFDTRHRGIITEEDIAACCPEIWHEYGGFNYVG